MEIYLMRHGHTAWNSELRMQGSSDIPLDEKGLLQVRQAAEGMRSISFDRIFSSPLSRALVTAKAVAEGRGVPVEIDARLTELNFGSMEGIVRTECADAQTYFHDPAHYIPWPGGETYEALNLRCRSILETLFIPLTDSCNRILVCSHGAFITGILRCIFNRSVAEFWVDPPQANCACTVLNCKNGSFTVLEKGLLFGRTQ